MSKFVELAAGMGRNSGSPQPRTSQIKRIPISAEAIPMIRRAESGVSSTCAIARLDMPGRAANSSPSMAKTKPKATRKSGIAPTVEPPAQGPAFPSSPSLHQRDAAGGEAGVGGAAALLGILVPLGSPK